MVAKEAVEQYGNEGIGGDFILVTSQFSQLFDA